MNTVSPADQLPPSLAVASEPVKFAAPAFIGLLKVMTMTSVLPQAAATQAGTPPVAPEQLARIEALLVHYVGPIASVLVKRAVKQAASRDALVTTLAGELDDETERAAFLKSCREIR